MHSLIPLYTQVLVTVPLAILKNNNITFDPELPDRKLKAIDRLGAGVIEKVRVINY